MQGEAVLLIAPESGGILASLAERVERLGRRLISPSSAFCRWAGDKSAVVATLYAAGVPVPPGVRLAAADAWPDGFPSPAVLKPNDGCGSQEIVFLDDASCDRRTTSTTDRRLERFIPGTAVSAAVIRGPTHTVVLPPCTQKLSNGGRTAYLGGACPLPQPSAVRAERLARRATAAMPAGFGYLGIDMVLGAADDGSTDAVIEVNPRLTTSYVGLRALCRTNLIGLMLDVGGGRSVTPEYRPGRVEFDADGTVRYFPAPQCEAAEPAVRR